MGRLPNGMALLAISLVLRSEGADYSLVAAASASFAVGVALGGPALGRLIDLIGQTRILIPSGALSAVGFITIAINPSHPAFALSGAALAGLAMPPLEPALRALWPDLTPRRLDAAYALDSGSQQLIFVAAPLIVAGCVEYLGPVSVLWACAIFCTVGTAIVASRPPSRRWRAPPRAANWLGPLRVPSLLAILATTATLGYSFGALNIAVVAVAEDPQTTVSAGVLLAINGLGALLGALVYGARSWESSVATRAAACLAGCAVSYAVLTVSMSIPALVYVSLGLAGAFFAPTLAALFTMITHFAPTGTVTEAFAWVVTLFTVGIALGSGTAGLLAPQGPAAPLGLAAGTLLLGTATILLGRPRRPGHRERRVPT
ncbi:MFS family permease [Pseudonocardia parietis]|uniref:MFS family permease n=1 Tax=Pseudonocardia parietis TaxID=570936 RepID=A0ABS4W6E3_9PSEU|nr:MFS transporter [Pseudonocardia parietis]MBP2371561.1 MFS family permease [Pseudonocardia parietis]